MGDNSGGRQSTNGGRAEAPQARGAMLSPVAAEEDFSLSFGPNRFLLRREGLKQVEQSSLRQGRPRGQ